MAGREHHAGIRPQLADGEGQLRRGARAFEEIGVAAEVRTDLCAELREVAGEVPGVVGEDQPRLAVGAGEVFRVGDQPADGAAEVVVIHRRRAGAGMLRPAIRSACALFGLGDHAADRPAAQAAGAEGEGFKKAVVEFVPLACVHQFPDRQRRDRARRPAEQGEDVGSSGFKQAARGDRGSEGIGKGAHFEPDGRKNPGRGNPAHGGNPAALLTMISPPNLL